MLNSDKFQELFHLDQSVVRTTINLHEVECSLTSGGQVRDKKFIDDPEKNAFCQSKAKSICSVLSKMQIGQTSPLLLLPLLH